MYPRGFTTPNILEAETNRALIDAGRRLVVVADHTKWEVIGVSEIAPLQRADQLITDDRLSDDARLELERRLDLVVVPPSAFGELRRQTA